MLTFGIAAALGTAFSWAISSVIHMEVARRLSVHGLLMLRQPLAIGALGLCALLAGKFVAYPAFWLGCAALSGFVAIFLHDWALYESIRRVGIRCALVCNSLSAVCTALLGVLLLDENLGLQGMCGIVVATFGVILVVASEHAHVTSAAPGQAQTQPEGMTRDYAIGVSIAVCTALLSAIGMIFSKAALSNGIPPLFMAMLRNVVAGVGFWIAGLCMGNIVATVAKAKTLPGLHWQLLAGCLFGPGGGTWMFMYAMQHCPAAVAATLVGLQPVALIFVTGLWEKRCPSLGSILGAITAVAGATLLLWR